MAVARRKAPPITDFRARPPLPAVGPERDNAPPHREAAHCAHARRRKAGSGAKPSMADPTALARHGLRHAGSGAGQPRTSTSWTRGSASSAGAPQVGPHLAQADVRAPTTRAPPKSARPHPGHGPSPGPRPRRHPAVVAFVAQGPGPDHGQGCRRARRTHGETGGGRVPAARGSHDGRGPQRLTGAAWCQPMERATCSLSTTVSRLRTGTGSSRRTVTAGCPPRSSTASPTPLRWV